MRKFKSLIFCSILSFLTFSNANSFEIVRDIELESFTREIVSNLVKTTSLDEKDLNIYFVNSRQINAFVTGGQNIFINTELIVAADDYREYAAVLAHELAHINGGHIFKTTEEIANLSEMAIPIYLLGIIGIMTGATETGIASVMVGQASVNDGFTYYSRTQEASADQAAVSILCGSKINAIFLNNFLDSIETIKSAEDSSQNYRSTHPSIGNRKLWISTALQSMPKCNFDSDELLDKRFNLLKAKIFGFTHSSKETDAVYNSSSNNDLYATAVSSYLKGDHDQSIKNLKKLISLDNQNPYFKELLAEIYFANQNIDKAVEYHLQAIETNTIPNDLYLMMMGNYLLGYNNEKSAKESIKYLKKSLILNNNNAYSWYLIARAYGDLGNFALANYATAERYFLTGERALSYDFALKAMKDLEEKSPEWYRSYDLVEILKKETTITR